MFKPDVQVKKLPVCGVKGCENGGFVLVGDRFLCGGCVMKVGEVQNKMLFEALEKKDGC